MQGRMVNLISRVVPYIYCRNLSSFRASDSIFKFNGISDLMNAQSCPENILHGSQIQEYNGL